MKYAIVQIGGHQYQVAEGDELEVEKLEVGKNKKVDLDQVLMVVSDGSIKIGQPVVKNAKVRVSILGQVKGDKIRVATYKAKSRYRRVKGHRQHLTRVKIEAIVEGKGDREKTPRKRQVKQKSKRS